ncbi:hypothetical protein DENSPDRAFT_146522 [Dentipellis sp. KUC8613]|nr:hypothetical protein DENSPDRAFT_146522 [Dentipellis sp. KUC8613]
MSTTTQILFNSPALHSLKREQLVKLCKIHSIKASGKNVELVERLKQHARTLPPSEPLSIAARSEEDGGDEKMEEDQESSAENEDSASDAPAGFGAAMPRPSEQWEIVMDDIEEETSSQGGTLTSMRTASSRTQVGEFGTGGSKSSSVSSSIKALATSLGLKRSNTGKSTSMLSIATSGTMPSDADDELERHSQPYSSLPEPSPSALPTMDHFKLSTPDTTIDPDSSMAPVPGQSSRPGQPAPSNARLSTGEGLTTTIRLVSAAAPLPIPRAEPGTPQLRPFATSFDLVVGSPDGESKIPVWPMSPQADRRTNLYPSLDSLPNPMLEGVDTSMADVQGTPSSTLLPKITLGTPGKPGPKKTPQRNSIKPSNDTVDIFSPMPSTSLAPPGSITRSQPFVFGSPLPENNVSNKAFGQAAASVLEEMNRRLSAVGGQKVGIDLLTAPPTTEASGSGSIFGSLGSRKADRFEKAHEEHFNKMDSIANHYAARRGAPAAQSKKRKSDVLGNGPAPAAKRTSAGTRVISTGVRKKMGIPGGFGDEDESDAEENDNAEENRRMSKRIRIEEGDGGKDKGKRVSLAPSPKRGGEVSEKDKKKKEREREATRKMLEIKREKRRSSIRRASGLQPVPGKVKGATSRFGFLASAKSMVKSVWGMGGGSNAKAAKPASSIPVSKPAPAKLSEDLKAGHARKPSVARPAAGAAASGSSNAKLSTGAPAAKTTASSSRARSPLPAFGSTSSKAAPPPTSRSRVVSGGSTAASRSSMATGVSTATSRLDVKSKASNNPSSMGMKCTTSTRTSTAGVSSLGAKRSLGPGTSGIPRTTSSIGTQGSKAPNSSIGRLSTSSRLFAPTASSLAKTRNSTSGLPKVNEKPGSSKASGSGGAALDQITNSPGSRIPKPSPTKIFSKPLSAASSPSLVPSPVRPTSLGVAASTLAGLSSPSAVPTKAPGTIPPKPKALAARRPRISRSRVIAKLGAQRAAAAAGTFGTPAKAAPRTRSSVGTAARRSYGGIKSGKVAGGEALMSAKKRARQSEYIRRRSRAAGGSLAPAPTTLFSAGDGSMSMEIDD